jgi:hypothetical protein
MKKSTAELDANSRKDNVSLVDIFDDFLFAGDKSNAGSHNPNGEGEEDFYSDESLESDEEGQRHRKKGRSSRNMTEEQKIERRYNSSIWKN